MRCKILKCWLLISVIGIISGCAETFINQAIPHMEKRDGMTKLIVDGRPFICVAGEVANTSSTDVKSMQLTIPRLAKANLNTILTVISWDLIEPEEGKYDFSMIDYQIEAARASNVRLIFLWMASWKNGLSHFPPEWVKANQERFPRVVNAEGNTLEILSTLSKNNRDADAKAFAAVMKHIRQVDSRYHTVIAIQVENEVGILGSTRDYCAAANEAFAKSVPRELMDYLQRSKDNLLPELKAIWNAAGNKTSGTWEEVFGKNVQRPDRPVPNSRTRSARPADAELFNHTDEIFMAWNYARYIGYIAAQGKKEYPLPMYVNAWIVQPNDLGPGDYPSGGPEPLVHDIWRAGAPAIDILAPDIYLPQYAQIIQTFARSGNPAFNPETMQNSANCWAAFTELNVLCYSPFGIDNLSPDSAFARTYGFISSISGAIAEAQGKQDAIRLITLAQDQAPGKVEMGDYVFDFAPAMGRRGGMEAPANPAEAANTPSRPGGFGSLAFLDAPFLLIINTAPNEYYFAANGNYTCRVSSKIPGSTATAASIDSGAFVNGKWVRSRRYNGDDIMGGGYDVSGAAAEKQAGTQIPLGIRGRGAAPIEPGVAPSPTVMRVRLYRYY
ncbi:MAG: beta-galactosidase [Sedimentisphaerales bacterium]|nr:beta-galactosidase [Sedimentisphaerales bacterium]